MQEQNNILVVPFKYNEEEYQYNLGEIEKKNSLGQWISVCDVEWLERDFKSEDIVTVCRLVLSAYYQGVDQGKWDKMREICNAIGATYL